MPKKKSEHEKLFEKALGLMQRNGMLAERDIIITGVSGGADSIALLHFLKRIQETCQAELIAVHVHHGLRGNEADGDEQFVRAFCKKLDVPLEVFHTQIRQEAAKMKLSEEEAGRLIRYRCFEEVRRTYGGHKIAVAHHANDNAETVLMNLARGTGMRGLAGIPAQRGAVIRPLLAVTKEDIEEYCEENGLRYVNDSTNESNVYTRNRIRNELLPYIQKNVNKAAVQNICRAASVLDEEDHYLDSVAGESLWELNQTPDERRVTLSAEALRKCHSVLTRRILRCACATLSPDLKDVTHTHICQMIELLNKNTGKTLCLPGGLTATMQYGLFVLDSKSEVLSGFLYELPEDVEVFVKETQCTYLLSRETEKRITGQYCAKVFRYDRIHDVLVIRSRNKGDRIQIDRIGGHKKISDYMTDEKIPRERREWIPLLADGRDILWIMDGKGIVSDGYKASVGEPNVVTLYVFQQ